MGKQKYCDNSQVYSSVTCDQQMLTAVKIGVGSLGDTNFANVFHRFVGIFFLYRNSENSFENRNYVLHLNFAFVAWRLFS